MSQEEAFDDGGNGERFLGLPPLPEGVASAAVIVPVPWERTTSYLAGTAAGPRALLRASGQVELYDEELDADTWRAGIDTAPPVRGLGDDPEAWLDAIDARVDEVLSAGAVAVLVGGEHTLTFGGVRAAVRRFPDLTVLQVDAHADLREAYGGDRWSHASVMARVRELCPHVGVGIRALSRAEAETVRADGLHVHLAHECRGPGWIDAALEPLGEHVYVTLDLDGLDPAVVPGVGTPVPGGLSWGQVLELLRRCATDRRIVGFDVVELSPPAAAGERSAFAAALLAYRTLGYVLTRGGTRPCPAVLHGAEPDEELS